MKRYSFRLLGVLRVRTIQENMARAALLDAIAVENQAVATLDRHLARYHGDPSTQRAEPSTTFLAHRDGRARTAATVADARGATGDAAERLRRRRLEWQAASIRVAALERLEARTAAEYAAGVRRDEEREVDDLVAGRHDREART